MTQGPLRSTRDDFWRMCWESNSRAIVMLTRCYEKGREKCDEYWPTNASPVYYGDISVQLKNSQRFVDWDTTEFVIKRGNEERTIRHYHFTTWPDFGVVPPQTLVRFVRAFRDRVKPDQRPIIVHCSAGVGRSGKPRLWSFFIHITKISNFIQKIMQKILFSLKISGTFIALDRLLQQIRVVDYVDIFNIVYTMRKGKLHFIVMLLF